MNIFLACNQLQPGDTAGSCDIEVIDNRGALIAHHPDMAPGILKAVVGDLVKDGVPIDHIGQFSIQEGDLHMVLFADLRPVGIVKFSHRVVAHRALIGEFRPAELLPHLICAKVKVHHIRFAARIIAGIKDHTKSRALQHRHVKFHVESIIKGFLPDGEHVAADADALVSAGDQGPIPAA